MKEILLDGACFVGLVLTFAWFIIFAMEDIASKGFLKEGTIRYGKIGGYVVVFGMWLALFLFFLSSTITSKDSLIDRIIEEKTIKIIPDLKHRQIEQHKEFLNKKKILEQESTFDKDEQVGGALC